MPAKAALGWLTGAALGVLALGGLLGASFNTLADAVLVVPVALVLRQLLGVVLGVPIRPRQ